MHINRFIIFIGLLVISSVLRAQADSEKLVADANKAYSEAKYNNAVELYEKILAGGYESAGLYYNLGNAYFKLNDIASAILYYEKSLKIRPGDENTEFNLKVCQTKTIDKIEELPVPFYKRFWAGLRILFSVNTWGILIIIAISLALICAALYLLAGRVWIRKTTFWLGFIFLLCTALSATVAYSQYAHLKDTPEAIIFDPTVHVKSSPDINSTDIFVIHEGTKVRITDHLGEWKEIRIANGSVGWVKAAAMKEI
jgi:tetratricopeptide (TPR) repeat protein